MNGRSGTGRRWRVLAVAPIAIALVLGGCTGVPSSSAPRTVQPIVLGRPGPTQPGPAQGADARTIVQDFLSANAVEAGNYDTAREYLTAAARADWSANATGTIISGLSVGTEQKGVVQVRGRVVGFLSQSGIYSPQLKGIGDGGDTQVFSFTVQQVNGQNRISNLPAGLLLTTDQFSEFYRPHALYFFDPSHRHLVPDTRWSPLEGDRLDSWLLAQVAAGARPDLSSAVVNDIIPTQNNRRITVAGADPLRIDIPGAAQLDSRSRTLLAAQVGATVTDPSSDESLQIVDSGSPVTVAGGGADFTAREAAYDYTPVPPPAEVFFLRNGEIVQASNAAMPGRLRNSPFFLTSVAVTQLGGTSDYTVAAVSGSGPTAQLYIGTEADGYRATGVRGVTSRPAWLPAGSPGSSTAPGEVWIGAGTQLVRLTVNGNRATADTVSISASVGRIVALRLSPEGSRVAMVIQSANGIGRLYIGSILRGSGQVRIDQLTAISPDGVSVTDAAWIGAQKLLAIGSIVNGDARIFETTVDGSLWQGRGIGSALPGPPDTVAVAVSQLAWVSVNGTVWRQSARSWTSPGSTDQTVGYDPVYLE